MNGSILKCISYRLGLVLCLHICSGFVFAQTEDSLGQDSKDSAQCHIQILDSLTISSEYVIKIKSVNLHERNDLNKGKERALKRLVIQGCQEDALLAVKSSEFNPESDSSDYFSVYDLYRERLASDDDHDLHEKESNSRNNVAIGYQIGGNTLLGFDYEYRVDDLFGMHAGIGYKGFDFGVRFHFNQTKHSPYFDFNYKDGGFGLVESVAIETGGTLPLLRDSGPRLSLGMQYILYIDPDFEYQFMNGGKIPSIIMAFQAGWAF